MIFWQSWYYSIHTLAFFPIFMTINKMNVMQLVGFIGPMEIILVLSVSLVMFVIPIIALIDILRSEFVGNNKLIWVLVILLTWILGAILYYFIGRKQKIENWFLPRCFHREKWAVCRISWTVYRYFFTDQPHFSILQLILKTDKQ